MYTEGFDQWLKMSKHLTSPIGDWNKVASDVIRRTTQQNLDIIGENFSRLSDQFKRLSHVRKPEDLLALQKDLINEDITAAINTSQLIIHTAMENMEEITKACGNVHPLQETMTFVKKERDREKEREKEKA